MKRLSVPEKIRKPIADFCRTRPRVALGIVLVLIAAIVIVIVLQAMARDTWRDYDIKPLGISVDLPAEPQLVTGTSSADATVYEVRTRDLAVVLGSFPRKAGTTPDRAELVERSIAYLADQPGIEGLRVEVKRSESRGQALWHVSGIFERQGVPCRAVGSFVAGNSETWQILCFFQAGGNGPNMAARVLRSARFQQR